MFELKDTKFDIFGTTYRIKFVESVKSDDENTFIWGDTDGRTHTIRIALKDVNGKKINIDEIKITILHELFHAILNEGQYRSSSEDEPLVEWLARCTNSLIKQGIL